MDLFEFYIPSPGSGCCGTLVSATIIVVVLWVALLVVALFHLRTVLPKTTTRDMLTLICSAFVAAYAGATAMTVAAALGASLHLFPPLFKIDTNEVYLLALLGAVTLACLAFAGFRRETKAMLGR